MEIADIGGRIHFIGVGGISMSALAKWCKADGGQVSGSDKEYSRRIDALNEYGIYAYCGQDITVAETADAVVYSSAIAENNAELIAAKNAGVPTYERHEFLGLLSKDFKSVVAVSGTHGKTTATSLIASIFRRANYPFTAHIGGDAVDIGGNFYTSGKDILVTEACEYRRNFLSLYPDCTVVLNIESDHPDCFSDIGQLQNAFAKFVKNTHNNGFIVLNDNVEYCNLHICENAQIIKFGLKTDSDVRAERIIERNGICEYDVIINKEYYIRVCPNLTGRHNIFNVLAAIAVSYLYGVDRDIVKDALENFGGVKRRFEKTVEINGAEIILDYAHHPTEIVAVIKAAKACAKGAVRVYFQPHTFSRTAKYFGEFSRAFNGADEVNFLPTYPARETPDKGKSAFELFYYVNDKVRDAKYFENFVDACAHITRTARPKDIILVLGAGDIDEMTKMIVETDDMRCDNTVN